MTEITLAPHGGFYLHLPSTCVEGASHRVEVPFTLTGLSALRRILREREVAPLAKLGEDASPIQAQVDAWLAADRAAQRAATAKQASEEKEALSLEGLDVSSLNL